ncbi:MAG: FkbM family methyltransferase [Clostridia bacterium]
MLRFNSIEEKVIYGKLTPNNSSGTEIISTANKEDISEHFNMNKILNYFTEINGYINILENTKSNFAYRHITSHRKFIGPIIVFYKKVARKLLKFYIEPIAFQQTEFNNAVTPTIGRMTEIQNELLKGINSLQNENINLKGELDNKQSEIERKLEEILNTQEVANDVIKLNEQKFKKLEELNPGIFKEKEFNFWDKRTVAQSGEDAICAYINMALGRPLDQCTYLDLGANHAKDLSNTYFFYSHGARGVLVEANQNLIPELKFYRNGDIILNKCISTRSGDYVDFYILNGDGLSTPDLDSANEFIAKNPELKIVDTVKIETISVNDIIENYLGKAPVIMNIDVEGNDLEILQSIDFSKYRPLIIIAEMIEYKPTLVISSKNKKISEFMEQNEYIEYAFTGINSIFIDKKQIEEVLP